MLFFTKQTFFFIEKLFALEILEFALETFCLHKSFYFYSKNSLVLAKTSCCRLSKQQLLTFFHTDDVIKVRGCKPNCESIKNDLETLQNQMYAFGSFYSFITDAQPGDKPVKIVCCKGDKCNDVATVDDYSNPDDKNPDDSADPVTVTSVISGSDVTKSRYVIAVVIAFAAFL